MALDPLIELSQPQDFYVLGFALVLLIILVVAFRSRAYVFCQYLKAMTGIALRPRAVRKIFRESGQDAVRNLFLDLIIHEDLKAGPLQIPKSTGLESSESSSDEGS